MIGDLQRGVLQAFGPDSDSVPVGAVLLSVSDVRIWLEQQKLCTAEWLTIPKVALLMQLKQQVVYDLVARELMPHVLGKRGERLVSREAIQYFRSAYVSLAMLVDCQQTSARSLLKKLNARPVTGPGIDGCRQYFYRRQDVAFLLQNF